MSPLDQVRQVLVSACGQELADAICDAYAQIERQYALGNWKASELDSGHFVEAVRRALELETTGTFTPIDQNLPGFSLAILGRYEGLAQHEDSVRFHIPRVLLAIYGVRNKRGVAHIGPVSANEMDSTLILYNVKWVLAELVRLKSALGIEETQALVNAVVEREISLLWKTEDFVTVLDPNLSLEDQILVLLYDGDKTIPELSKSIPDRDPRTIKSALVRMAKAKILANPPKKPCVLSPVGRFKAEKVIEGHEFAL